MQPMGFIETRQAVVQLRDGTELVGVMSFVADTAIFKWMLDTGTERITWLPNGRWSLHGGKSPRDAVRFST